MYYKVDLDGLSDALDKRRHRDLIVMCVAVGVIGVLVGVLRTGIVIGSIVGVISGILGTKLINKDLDNYKRWLLKQELYKKSKTTFELSGCVDYLHFSSDISSEVRSDVEKYILANLSEFKGIIDKRGLQVVITDGTLSESLQSLLGGVCSISIDFSAIDDDTSGMYLSDIDYIVIRYIGLPLNSVIGHEVTHFLMSSSKCKLLKDATYVDSYKKEKDIVFPLVYQDYYRADISEFSAELGAMLLEGSISLDTESSKILNSYINTCKMENNVKKLLK